jgi:hypothetical protein
VAATATSTVAVMVPVSGLALFSLLLALRVDVRVAAKGRSHDRLSAGRWRGKPALTWARACARHRPPPPRTLSAQRATYSPRCSLRSFWIAS